MARVNELRVTTHRALPGIDSLEHGNFGSHPQFTIGCFPIALESGRVALIVCNIGRSPIVGQSTAFL